MRAFFVLAAVFALTFVNPDTASARVFEPQANWWNAGQTCAASRNPPGRRWRALPPRSCARADREHATSTSAEAAKAKPELAEV